MADGGIEDILISYNLIGAARSGRLGGTAPARRRDGLRRQSGDARRLRGGGSDRRSARSASSSNATRAASAPASRRPARRSNSRDDRRDTEGLEFRGLLFYPTERRLARGAAVLRRGDSRGSRRSASRPRIVSTGGTPNLANVGKLVGATEHRAGTYIFNDRMMVACGAATLDDCALTVFTTVVSRAGPERGILDAGLEDADRRSRRRPGRLSAMILEYPQARIRRFRRGARLSRSRRAPTSGPRSAKSCASCRTTSASSSTWSTS